MLEPGSLWIPFEAAVFHSSWLIQPGHTTSALREKKVATVRNCSKSFYISLSLNQILSSWIYRPFSDFLFSMPCYSWPYPLWAFARTWGTKNTNPKVRRGPRAPHTNTKSEGGYKKGLPSPQIRHQDFLLTEMSKSSPSLQKIDNVPLRTMSIDVISGHLHF